MSANSFNVSIPQISVEELAPYLAAVQNRPDDAALAADRIPQLIDVREPEELSIVSLDGFVNLPLSQFAEWSEQIALRLNRDAETIVMCHHGIRSAQMCYWLQQQGFANVKNLAGGIAAYASVVDPSLPQY